MRLVADRATGYTEGASDRPSWTRTRFQAALAYVTGQGLASGAAANLVAVCAVALWAWETGWGGDGGRGEHAFNVGNVHATNAYPGDAIRVQGRRGAEILRAYASLALGVADWFALVRRENPTAWGMLVAGDLAYWARLQRDGVYGRVPVEDAISVWQYVAAQNGVAQMNASDVRETTAVYTATLAGPATSEDAPSSSSGAGLVVVGALGVYVAGELLDWW